MSTDQKDLTKKINPRKGHVVYDPHAQPNTPLPNPNDYYDSYEGGVMNVSKPGWSAILPNGIDMSDFDRECEHDPIEVGFNVSKVVCKKCDQVLPQGALYDKKTI